ncbi:uncharacterized protein L969DRAFT_94124 [Mixia osmundae IAM 14324]|uniref:Pop1 N-terminal domain-containing protein n=1 Tax=Mixia osmundae (strain CBS 9802 / IAM 14324 / JCM 22182 / KY 12970) TaxID=764103 RepID=G7E2S2_MIXOS|nr:uncharacterized protein L969DRAFT_94124 [Mixia osmundae IAM 14324]KEI40317.1 hypothetical protein L969DRAFT_94124 [Mixia osmundae IAM 14324]GAA97132.1 hypothetical protein E5Q_03807 [Mixia osmundae IAM 14324]
MTKRPNPFGGSGRDAKRAFLQNARKIQVQQPSRQGALDNNVSKSSEAALPTSIDVERFLQSRAFEIGSWENAMRTSKNAVVQRAFQSLPRHLRRRAASHNARRLPARLRAKARSEIVKDKSKSHTIRKLRGFPFQKRRKLVFISRSDMLAKRQKNGKWLETHVWHAKRMKMVERWGYKLAEKPTEKCFRAAYRATFSDQGCTVHDSSYFTHVSLQGSQEELGRVLNLLMPILKPSPTALRFMAGARHFENTIYWPERDLSGIIGPVLGFWSAHTRDTPTARQVMLRLHPSIIKDASKAIRQAIALVSPAKGHTSLTVDKINVASFDLFGAQACATLARSISPVKNAFPGQKAGWQGLMASMPSQIPSASILGLRIVDPRLSFPPKKPADSASCQPRSSVDPEAASLPSFWDLETVNSLSKPRYSKAELDRRRSKMNMPGSSLDAQETDDRLPVLVLQRSLGEGSSTPAFGLTVIAPSAFARPLLQSLVFCQPRPIGQREVTMQHFESGLPAFPHDWLGTAAGEQEMARRAETIQLKHARTPRGKRAEYDRLGVTMPFKPDWPALLAVGNATPWLAPRSIALKLVEALDGKPTDKADSAKRFDEVLKNRKLLATGVCQARLIPSGRGVPKDRASVFVGDGQDAKLVGFVTSGSFSLSHGRGRAICMITLKAFLDAHASKNAQFAYRNVTSRDRHRAVLELA